MKDTEFIARVKIDGPRGELEKVLRCALTKSGKVYAFDGPRILFPGTFTIVSENIGAIRAL